MRIHSTVASLAGLFLLSACAATTPPPRLSVVDPADPQGPEASPLPPSNVLRDLYTCAQHPQIERSEAGKCPVCGTALVPKKAPPSPGSDQP